MFAETASEKGLEFALTIEPAARGLYRGDRHRVRQLLYNLIANALKFTEAGAVSVSIVRRGDGLELRVADSGPGIAAEDLPRLFEKFVQLDASTTRKHGGTGLGLSICRDLVELMGGRIGVETVVGQGATFTVELPLPRIGDSPAAVPQAAPTAASPSPAEQTLRVLAAEDNQVNQMVLKTLLRHAGIEPVVVENGAEAVAAWEAGEWDLILMDVQMPLMDGPSAARMIRRREAELGRRHTPIVALTANVMTHQVAGYAAAGMDGFIPKPIEVTQLFATLDEMLVRSAPDAQAMAS